MPRISRSLRRTLDTINIGVKHCSILYVGHRVTQVYARTAENEIGQSCLYIYARIADNRDAIKIDMSTLAQIERALTYTGDAC